MHTRASALVTVIVLASLATGGIGCGGDDFSPGAATDPSVGGGTDADGGSIAIAPDASSRANDASPASSNDAGASDASTADSAPPPSKTITCTGASAGAYCGGDDVTNGDPATLYDCPGAGKPPASSTKCAAGCQVNPPGTDDACKISASPNGYKLPWPAGTSMQLTQDCNDSCCNDHVGVDGYAWDFANGGGFAIHAARGGTITHLKVNSTTGCGTSGCVNDANFIVIDHGDGTESVYLHEQGMTLEAGVACGKTVAQGERLATSGTTGWSTGIHLHFQVNKVHAGAPTCECGAGGDGCDAATAPWGNFWASATYPTLPIAFAEWPRASTCADRRITMPASQN